MLKERQPAPRRLWAFPEEFPRSLGEGNMTQPTSPGPRRPQPRAQEERPHVLKALGVLQPLEPGRTPWKGWEGALRWNVGEHPRLGAPRETELQEVIPEALRGAAGRSGPPGHASRSRGPHPHRQRLLGRGRICPGCSACVRQAQSAGGNSRRASPQPPQAAHPPGSGSSFWEGPAPRMVNLRLC